MKLDDTTTDEGSGTRFLSLQRYADVSAVLKDSRFGAPAPPRGLLRGLRLVGLGNLANSVEFGFLSLLNASDHVRLRQVVEPFFHNRAVASLRPVIARNVDALLDRVEGTGEFDFVRSVASELPTRVVAEVFGFPAGDIPRLNRWAHDLAPLGDQELHRPALLRGVVAFLRFRRLVLRRVEERGAEAKDDLLTALADAREGPERITSDEVVGLAVLVFTAGHITTAHLIGTTALMLLRDPDIAARARRDPDAVGRLVGEALRLYSPSQRIARVALQDAEIGGTAIPAGTTVRLKIGEANLDPERFSDPGEVRLDRPNTSNLAFAAGPHHCFGNHLARLEAEIAIGALLRRFPDATLSDPVPTWRRGTKFLGLSRLSIRTGGEEADTGAGTRATLNSR